MESDCEEDSLLSHREAVKTDVKAAEDSSQMQIIVGTCDSESDLPERSVVLDFSLIRAAYEYYKYQKDKKHLPSDISSSSSNNKWDDSSALIKETDSTQPPDPTNDLEKTLSDLQMDSDLISEWPKFNTDFLNLYNFFDEQIESSDSLGNQSTLHESSEASNLADVNFKAGNSDFKEFSKSLGNDCSEGTLPETDNESFETRSAVSKSSSSLSQHSENTGEERSVLKHFHIQGYFPEELDYEPSEAGETEAKESDNESCVDNPLKEKETESCSPSENPTFHKRIEEMDTPVEQTETCTKQDFVGFFENNFEPESRTSRLQDNYGRYIEYEEEDDSESDSEHSFKRTSSSNRQVNGLESVQPSIINLAVSKVCHLNSIDEVMIYICEQCKCGNVNEAIAVANRYIAISREAVQLEIFKDLFISVIDLIKRSVYPIGDVRISKNLGEIMEIFHENKLFNSDLCSLIINECFKCDHAIKTGKEFLSFIQKIKVPINSNAILSCINAIMPSEIPSLELISFLEYVKYVCNLPCPKTLISEALGQLSKKEEGSLPVGFFRLCKFLCSVSSKEITLNHLRNFIEFCIKNDHWPQISNFFRAWCNTDGHLIGCLVQSFLFRPEDVGLAYKKLADEIYKHGDASLYLVGILGQVGVSLMLEVFSRKLYNSAFEVLFTLHRHNINYLELQASLYKAPSDLRSIPNFADLFVFPFTVAFAALDICLHLERFRDAYCVFQSFSLCLPADMDEKWKMKVRSRRFRYLLKLARELFSLEPLKLGLQAFHDIHSTAEEFSLEQLEEFAEEIQTIYNKYLTYVVNGCQLRTALELFDCSEGAMKEVFVLHPEVLRGLLVTFAQNDKVDEAYKFFSLGCRRKVYNIEETEDEEFVWCLTVMSSWTIFEVEFVIKSFIKKVCLVWESKIQTRPHIQLLVKIMFKEPEEDSVEVECLKKPHSMGSAKEIVCNVLQSLDSSIKWVENQNPVSLELVFETVYNYWINKSPNILRRKNSRKNFLEDVRPNAEFKYSTEFNSVKSLEKVLDPLTPEYSVADTSYQLISDKTSDLSLTAVRLESCQPTVPETTFLEDNDCQFSDNAFSRGIEQEQIISDLSVSRSIEQEQIISDLSVSRSIEQEQIISDLSVSRSIEQEQIISSSNQLSPDAHSNKITCPTPDEKVSETDASESLSTNFCSDQVIPEKKVRKVCKKFKMLKSLGQSRSKKIISKAVKLKKKYNRVPSRNKPVSKKDVTLLPKTEELFSKTKNQSPDSSEQACSSKPCMVENFKITLRTSTEDRVSRVVSHASVSEPKDTNVSNVPESVFQKVVLFLRSKVLLKCKDLQAQQQQDKANHLANLFIQRNVVDVLNKKTMKLLSEFAEDYI